MVDHKDSDHRIDRAGILPRPKRKIPIWLGGFSEAAYDRAARIGDGFLFSGRTQTEAVQIKARIDAKLVELGRDDNAFGFESIQQYSRGDNQWPSDIAAWREAGGSHISVVTMGANLTTVDGHIEAIKTTFSRIPASCAREETPESRGMPCLFLNTERGFGNCPRRKPLPREPLRRSPMQWHDRS